MDVTEMLLLFGGGMLAGLINVMAGGAGFLTFPLLVASGMSEIEANASNFVALLPANVVGSFVYRHELKSVRKNLGLRFVLAAVGGTIGSLILVKTGQASFQRAIPWLLLFATLSFALGPWLKKKLEAHVDLETGRWLWLSLTLEFLIYVYGGYFGLGMGIVIFAVHSMFSRMNVHESNAIRNVTITLMTLIGIAIFAGTGLIRWLPSLVMMAGAVVGGYVTSHIARRMPAQLVRSFILVWAVCLTAFAFRKYF